jgi:hypothetical protein
VFQPLLFERLSLHRERTFVHLLLCAMQLHRSISLL